MTTNKKGRERLREAMSKSLAASPKRQEEIAEMVRGRLGPPIFGAGPNEHGGAAVESEVEECYLCGKRFDDLSAHSEAAWGGCGAVGADQRGKAPGLGGAPFSPDGD